jgi:DNA polymerase elongation subunit (family B)
MKEIANKQFGMNIIYGDTDSIFVSGINLPNTLLKRTKAQERNNVLDIIWFDGRKVLCML